MYEHQTVCDLKKSAVFTSSAKQEEQHHRSAGAVKPLTDLQAMFPTISAEANWQSFLPLHRQL